MKLLFRPSARGAKALSVLALLAALVAPFQPCRAETGTKAAKIGIVPFYTPEKIWKLYQPFIQYLNRSTDWTWDLRLGDNHDELINALCRGDVGIAYLGPVPFAKAADLCALKPILLPLGPDGKTTYRSIIVTADPGLRSLSDVKGRKFGFFQRSTASHYLPLKMLAEAGLVLKDIQPVYFPSQDRIIAAVLSNEVAGGGVKESLYETFKNNNLRILKTSEPLPMLVFCASPSLPAAAAKAFADALLRLNPLANPADKQTVIDWDPELWNGFAVPNRDYGQSAKRLVQSLKPFMP